MKMELIYVVCSSLTEAKNIGRHLIEAQLCACVNILPGMTSMYMWENEINESEEVVLLVKTQKDAFDKVNKRVLELHSYEVPAVFSIPTGDVNPAYQGWLSEVLQG